MESSPPSPSTNTKPRFSHGAEPRGCQPPGGHPPLSKHPRSPCQPGGGCSWGPRSSSQGAPPPRSRPVTTKARAIREAPLTVRAPASRTGAAGASGLRLRGRGAAASAVLRDPHPTSPPPPGLHSPGRILLLSGAQRPPRTSASSRLRRSLRSRANPLFLFSVGDAPKGRGAWLRAEGSSLALLNGAGKRVPAPSLRAQPPLAASVPLRLAEPGSGVGSGIWIPASFQGGLRKRAKMSEPFRGRKETALLDASLPLKVPRFVLFSLF